MSHTWLGVLFHRQDLFLLPALRLTRNDDGWRLGLLMGSFELAFGRTKEAPGGI